MVDWFWHEGLCAKVSFHFPVASEQPMDLSKRAAPSPLFLKEMGEYGIEDTNDIIALVRV